MASPGLASLVFLPETEKHTPQAHLVSFHLVVLEITRHGISLEAIVLQRT